MKESPRIHKSVCQVIRNIAYLFISYFIVSCDMNQEIQEESGSIAEEKVLVEITEMGCRSCARRIKKYFYQHQGIKSIKASIPDKTLLFELTSKNYHSKIYLKSMALEAIFGKSKEKRACAVCSRKISR